MFGYTLEELRGMDTSVLFVCQEDYERVGREIALQIPQGLVCTLELEFKRKNGARFWCFAQGRALDAGDLSAGVIWMLIDITERRQAERRMQIFSREVVTARENEKRHLSSVLHHDVGSLAVGISAYLDAIEEDLRSEKPGKALRWMQRTRRLLDESLQRLKGIAVELRPPELDVLGLSAALRQHFSLVTKRGGIRIRFKAGQHGNRLIGDTAVVLFRVAQEALTNAVTHGFAKRVAVDLLTLKKEVRLTIRDNGTGFDPSKKMTLSMSHLGLRVMREMADFAGGAFTIDSSPGNGTTVRLTLPIATAPAAPPLPPPPRPWPAGRRGRDLELTGAAAREETKARGRNIRSAVRSLRPRKGSRA
jgi:PAS domain S-box-containing protein